MTIKIVLAEDAISYIHQLPRLHRKNDLFYVKQVLSYFGNPQDSIKAIHITGTNGKGSTSYYLNSLLQKAGYKTGLFVSPFILEFNERIQIDSQNISGAELIRLTNKVRNAVADIDVRYEGEDEFVLTEFEFLVAMAFIYFTEQSVDFAIIEAGIGAKHDKTNVITPIISLITSVGLDHEKLIGPTLTDIAYEKSGIIKRNVPLVLGQLNPEVLSLMQNVANNLEAPTFDFGRLFKIQSEEHSFKYQFPTKKLTLEFKLRPYVEQIDISLAVTAYSIIDKRLTPLEIEEAINETQIVGRYQIIQSDPVVIADGAHNVQAMSNFYEYLKTLVGGDARKIHFLITLMKDKDILEVVNLIKETDITLTTIDNSRAAKQADYIAAGVREFPFEADFRTAYKNLKQKIARDDIIAISGSFYFATDFLKYVNMTEDDR